MPNILIQYNNWLCIEWSARPSGVGASSVRLWKRAGHIPDPDPPSWTHRWSAHWWVCLQTRSACQSWHKGGVSGKRGCSYRHILGPVHTGTNFCRSDKVFSVLALRPHGNGVLYALKCPCGCSLSLWWLKQYMMSSDGYRMTLRLLCVLSLLHWYTA